MNPDLTGRTLLHLAGASSFAAAAAAKVASLKSIRSGRISLSQNPGRQRGQLRYPFQTSRKSIHRRCLGRRWMTLPCAAGLSFVPSCRRCHNRRDSIDCRMQSSFDWPFDPEAAATRSRRS